ncbi:UNVERIFIED_CONTAM: hypothetical protein H355_009366 [Colinus virginianus]|nr:hypothetical protein H355_009366 [Colinus virginianus]
MASEAHNVKKQRVLHIEGRPVDLPRKRVSSSTKKIMKEDKKSPKQLASYTNRYVIVGLNWLQAVIKRWWSELSANTERAEDG